jgi:hypothetical protein
MLAAVSDEDSAGNDQDEDTTANIATYTEELGREAV